MSTSARIRVLVVDDQAIVRQGLAVILGCEPDLEVAGVAADGAEAVAQALHLCPDVVIMDLKMPRLNGIHATRQLVQQLPGIKVLVLTTYDGDEWLFDALRAGACGYLLKDSESAAIVAAVRGAAAGEVHLDPHVAGKVLQAFTQNQAPSPGPSPDHVAAAAQEPLDERLSERELAVLQQLAQGRSNQEIAASLFLAEGTVKNYVSTIMAKLQANDRTQAAIIALKRGLARLE